MTDAREIIAQHAWGELNERHAAADIIIDALKAAGIRLAGPEDRILGPDELDPVTLEKCAEIADARYEGHSVAFGTMRARNYEHAGSTIGTAIRAIGRKA